MMCCGGWALLHEQSVFACLCTAIVLHITCRACSVIYVSSSQQSGVETIRWHVCDYGALGSGTVSPARLGPVLLLRLEGHQIHRKGEYSFSAYETYVWNLWVVLHPAHRQQSFSNLSDLICTFTSAFLQPSISFVHSPLFTVSFIKVINMTIHPLSASLFGCTVNIYHSCSSSITFLQHVCCPSGWYREPALSL